jgi:hypothetical protein
MAMPPPPRRLLLLQAGALLLGCLIPGASWAQAQPAGSSGPVAGTSQAPVRLYTLATQCSLQGGRPEACTVEALDQGTSTLYLHRIGAQTIAIRITDNPVTMARQNGAGQKWEPLRTAGARFSTNSVCFNGRELCVVNPNYLNSVREDRQDLRLQGRDLVKVHFGPDGRVDATCYDTGCEADLR